MPAMIFVNQPVTDLRRSTDFYTALGYGTNPSTGRSASSTVP